MKTVDVVPGILCDCFLSNPSSDLVDGSEICVTKLDVLKYVQYLRTSTKLDSNGIYNIVTNHVEKLKDCGSKYCVKRYLFLHVLSFISL